ncbi:MAG: hypothetical protein Q7U57_17640 [Methylovulum sp.]|nr:hypothetical protein [Methylovulum sp.]
MNSLIYRRIVKGLTAIGMVILITMPGEVFGLVLELLHILWELFVEFLDVSFEWVESMLDHVVEHIFETDLHDTQIIVFYILVSIGFLIGYRLCRIAPKIYRRLQEHILATWLWHKTRTCLYWQSQTLINKIKLVAMSLGIVYVLIFFSL